jgi:archaellum component FlaG (FlaF/FlaG flagellin family)
MYSSLISIGVKVQYVFYIFVYLLSASYAAHLTKVVKNKHNNLNKNNYEEDDRVHRCWS